MATTKCKTLSGKDFTLGFLTGIKSQDIFPSFKVTIFESFFCYWNKFTF